MTPKKSPPEETLKKASSRADSGKSSVRSEAEARLAARKTADLPEEQGDTRRLLHELQVHQIELEMQNEELVRVQGELELTRDRYFNLFDLAPVGILTLDEEGVILEANLTAATQLGLTRNKLVKHAFAHFILPEDQDIYYLHHQQLFENGTIQACEMRMLRADKGILWVTAESSYSHSEIGTRLCQVVLSDITERKRTEKELYALSSRNEAILVSVPDIIMEVDKNKVYTWANPAGLEFFGEGVIGKDADFYFEGEQATYDIVAPLFVGSEDFIYVESWQRRKDGAKRLLAWWCRVLKDAQGNVTGVISTARDITERKLAGAELIDSELKFRQLFEKAPLGYQSLDINGNFIHVNQAWLEMLGYESEEVLGHWFGDFLLPEHRDDFKKRFPMFKSAGQIHNEFEMRHKNGSLIFVAFEGRIGYDLAGEFKQTHCMLQDITERKHAQKELLRLNEDLDLMNAVNTALNNGETLETILNLISEKVKAIFNSFGTLIHLVNSDRTRLVMQNLTIPSRMVKSIEKLIRIQIPRIEHDLQTAHPYRQVFKTGRPQLISDSDGIQEFMKGYILCLNAPEKTRARLEGLLPAILKLIKRRSVMVIPLLSKNVIIGTMDVGSRDLFSEQDLLRLEAITGSLTAVIQRKLDEQKLAASESNLRALFAAMTDVVIKYDAEGRYLEIAPTNPENLFRPLDDMLGKTVHDILPKEQADYILTRIKESLQTGQVISGEYSLPIDSREIWFTVNVSPLPDNTVIWMAHEITARKQAADLLLESERRFRQTLENVNLISIELDISGNITFCNDYFLQLTGWGQDEIIGKNWISTCLPDRITKDIGQVLNEALVSGDAPSHHENEILTRQGAERLVSWSNTVLRDPAGKPIGISSIGEDITEKRRTEQHIKRSETELKKAQAYAHVGSWIWDIKNGKLEWSDEMFAIFGISKENFSGNLQEVVANAIHPDDRQKVEESNLMVANEGKPIPLEYRILHPDGSERVVWAEAGELELDSEGKPALLRGVVMDITERKNAEEVVRRSENQLRAALDATPFPVALVDVQDENILYWSKSASVLFGHTAPTTPEWYLIAYPDPAYRAVVIQRWKTILEESKSTGQPKNTGEYRVTCRDGSVRICELYATFLSENLIVTFNDITERKQAEEKLRDERQRLNGILEGTNAGTWEWNVQTGETLFNDRWAEVIGYTLEEISPVSIETWMKYAHPDDLKVSNELLEKHFHGENDYYEFESRMKHKDGKWIWVIDRGKVISWSEDGKPLVMMGTHQDITKSKLAEEKLLESERRYRERATELETIMDIVPVALWVAQDPSCHSIIGNRTANELHRVQPGQNPSLTPAAEQQLRPSNMRIFHDGEEITAQELPLQVCASKGIEIRDFESQILFDDGTVIHEIGNAKPLFDENGQPRGAVGAFTDITGLKQVEEEIRHRAEELDALQRTMLDITSAQNLPGLLESIVERACQLLGAPGGGLYLNDPDKEEVRCVVSYNTPANYVGIIVKHGEGVAGRVSQTGESISVEDYKNWVGRAKNFELDRQLSAVVGVPLMWGGQVSGVIDVLHYEDGKCFSQADIDLLNLFAGHAAIAIENSRLLEASLAGEAEVRTLSTRLAEAEENERRRIARELHDQVGQSLSALSINMNIMSSQIPEYLPGFKRRLDDSLMLIDQTTDHIRNLMSELRPAVLDDYGLKAALDWAAGSVANRTNLDLLVEGECNRFPPRVEISLFRIAQEALGNITRHAYARNVKILLTQGGPDMSMSITDDGVGFDPSAVAATEKSGWGLRLMAERADSIGASLQVESAPGQGTTITVRYHDQDSTGR